jgi:hypothetical protein
MTGSTIQAVQEMLEEIAVLLARMDYTSVHQLVADANSELDLALPVRERVIRALVANGGEYCGLWNLSRDICTSYSYLWHVIREMESQNVVEILGVRQVGKKITVRLCQKIPS